MAPERKHRALTARTVALLRSACRHTSAETTGFTLQVIQTLRRYRSSGVTLIEFLAAVSVVAVAIIGIAALVAIYSFGYNVESDMDRQAKSLLGADLLIETESELRKVTWPTVPEAVRSSIVVIACVLFLMAFLAGADWLLGRWADRLLLGS